MIAGRKMSAIFGFAIVRNFSDCTECLQEDVMVFVNTIAEIVHRAVKDNNGAPNKNIGEAFLLVWRQAGSEVEAHNVQDDAHSSSNRSCHSGTSKGSMADSALKSFIRAALEVQASEHLRKITDHQKIQERLPGFHVSMGFGLHVGWAIEGAIGSMRKIDASYLSPNVNLAARLESGCHQFHVDILISEDTYRLLSPRVQMLCRRLDRVTVKGSEQPMSLYTYDLPPSSAKTVSE
jgi:class 3 adenylate cyclase